ncbi:hypothetical protein B0O99DRAFT_675951 [Bisporella sp. PMI_857]|nr:hypothetical protein B0O99DRAFT_675951 [Bisporella sp. PMI_857]
MHHIEKIVDIMSKTLEQTAVNNTLSTIKDLAALSALNIIHTFPPQPCYDDKYAYRLWMKVVKHLDCLAKVLDPDNPLSWDMKVPLYCRNSMMLIVQAGDDLGDFATIGVLNEQRERETDDFDEEQNDFDEERNADVKQEDNTDFGAKQVPRDKVVAQEVPTNAVRRPSTHETSQQSESSLILKLKKLGIYHLISDTPSVGFPQYVKVLGQLYVTPYRVWKDERGDHIEGHKEETQFIAVIDLSDPWLSIWAVALNVAYDDLADMYCRKTLYSEDPLFDFFKVKKFDIAKLGTLRTSRSGVDTFLDKDVLKMVDATKAVCGYSLDYLDDGTYQPAAKAVSEGWGVVE